MATTKLLTAEDLWEMEDDGCRHELMRGELITLPPTKREHGKYLIELGRLIGNFLVENPIGEVYGGDSGYILSRNPDVLLAPDISVIRNEHLPEKVPESGFEELVPDIAVEVISPSERVGHINRKVNEYLSAGVQLVWLVDASQRNVTVHAPNQQIRVLEGDDELDGGEVLPGFRVRVSEMFR